MQWRSPIFINRTSDSLLTCFILSFQLTRQPGSAPEKSSIGSSHHRSLHPHACVARSVLPSRARRKRTAGRARPPARPMPRFARRETPPRRRAASGRSRRTAGNAASRRPRLQCVSDRRRGKNVERNTTNGTCYFFGREGRIDT